MASELCKPRAPHPSTQAMLMAVDEDGDGLVSFTELVKSLGIKTHEMLQEEKQQRARRGEDDHSVEERYGYFAHVEHRAVSAEFAHLVGRRADQDNSACPVLFWSSARGS